jgi:hypothetical protein
MKRFLAILVAILVLALPAATMADYTQNALCTIELHVKQPNMRVLTDYTDRSFVNFEEGDWFSVKWQDQVEVAAVYWEWWHLPARALVECFNDDVAAISMISIGLIGTVLHPLWLRNIYERFMKRRYENMDGFRNSR